jgi:hypothetical protein
MPTVRTQIIVAKCQECPFYERGVASIAADFLLKRSTTSGACKYGVHDQPFPLGRRQILDDQTVPSTCPLNNGDCLIQLASKLP